jgi:hypothetical protein
VDGQRRTLCSLRDYQRRSPIANAGRCSERRSPEQSRAQRLSRPSRPGEFHPEPLTDPDLTLSRHPARATARRLPPSIEYRVPPVAVDPISKAMACPLMHGGARGSGGPQGDRNGNFKHGVWTRENVETRMAVRAQIREIRALLLMAGGVASLTPRQLLERRPAGPDQG